MTDFLLELRCEEIPARMQAKAREELATRLGDQLANVGLHGLAIETYTTPRRLAAIVRNLPETTPAGVNEIKGPRTSAPQQAFDGFLRSTGLTPDQLEDRAGIWFAVVEKPGRLVKEVLAEAIPAIVAKFSWPKSMRWGAGSISTESTRWVRPLSGIVAIFGEDLVECEAGGITSGFATLGHRFHHPGPITLGGAHDYKDKLRACHVIVDHAEREALVRELARAAALAEGLTLVEDEGLVIENAGLTEWPVPLLGRFDPAFLEVPPEVIQLTARVNQKYFVCTQRSSPTGGGEPAKLVEGAPSDPAPDGAAPPPPVGEDRLANAFVCTANIAATDGGTAIVDGNRKVLAARLSDARFFWEQDQKKPLAEHAEKLARITFHEKLGTVADKVERVAKLARWLVEEGIVKSSPSTCDGEGDRPKGGGGVGGAAAAGATPPSGAGAPATSPSQVDGEDRATLANLAEQAARLAKADLVTDMVGEFPELQGLMGGYYARAEGLPDAVADAIRDHYKPVGQGDEVPTAPVTVAVSLADKLDTLFSFFLVRLTPTGSRDPFALRRAALGAISLLNEHRLRVRLSSVFDFLLPLWKKSFGERLDKIDKFHGLSAQDFRPMYTLSEDGKRLSLYLKDEMQPEWDVSESELPTIEAWLDVLFADEIDDTLLLDFFADRLKVQQREAGVRHDLIDAVFALGNEDDLVRLLARVHALQAFIATEDGTNLLAGYKRAANILKKENWHGLEGEIPVSGEEDPGSSIDIPELAAVAAARMEAKHENQLSYTPEPDEKALIEALDSAGPQARAAVEGEDFAGAMSALASLRAPIDRFFDSVTVNDADPAKRSARLDLLARFRAAVHDVADFSRIEG